MTRVARSCIQSLLKLVNSVMGLVGMALIMYAVWMINLWYRKTGELPFRLSDFPAPWFIFTSLVLGLAFGFITCTGHIAAATANACCLYLYMMFMFLLLMLEAGVTADVILNREWEEDFPDDPSGNFYRLRDFVRSNFNFCKWIGLSIVAVQGLSILLAMVLKGFGPGPGLHQNYDSDDEYIPETVPLLRHGTHTHACVGCDPIYGSKNDAWNIKINNKSN